MVLAVSPALAWLSYRDVAGKEIRFTTCPKALWRKCCIPRKIASLPTLKPFGRIQNKVIIGAFQSFGRVPALRDKRRTPIVAGTVWRLPGKIPDLRAYQWSVLCHSSYPQSS